MTWATLSDYIGRANTYTAFFVIQAAAFLLLPRTSGFLWFQALLFLIMTCYGGGFSCIPAFIGDLFGTKQLGTIHGYTLTTWAATGLNGPLFAAWVRIRGLPLLLPRGGLDQPFQLRLPRPPGPRASGER